METTRKLYARWDELADQIGTAMSRMYARGDEAGATLAAGIHARLTRVVSYLGARLERRAHA